MCFITNTPVTSRADPQININADVAVGDLLSNEVGSGARKNGNKVNYGLLPLGIVLNHIREYGQNYFRDIGQCFHYLERWQAQGSPSTLEAGLACTLPDTLQESLADFADCARVLDYGRGKYAPWNWAKGMPWSVPFACAIRHLIAIQGGEEMDPESGCSHWGHVTANILMLLLFQRQYPQLNDMPFGVLQAPCSI